MVNHISKYSKLAQKEYKTKHEWVEKMINRKMCKRLNFYHFNKWYVHKSEFVLENEAQ